MGKLNPKQVENLTEPGTYEDGDGLRLVVKATGRKSWVLRFQLGGKRREMGLGSFPEVSLKGARLAAGDQRKLLAAGSDPMAARDAERERQREAQRIKDAHKVTFEKLATEYWEAHGSAWSDKTRTADEVRGQIEQVLDAAKARRLRDGDSPARWRRLRSAPLLLLVC